MPQDLQLGEPSESEVEALAGAVPSATLPYIFSQSANTSSLKRARKCSEDSVSSCCCPLLAPALPAHEL